MLAAPTSIQQIHIESEMLQLVARLTAAGIPISGAQLDGSCRCGLAAIEPGSAGIEIDVVLTLANDLPPSDTLAERIVACIGGRSLGLMTPIRWGGERESLVEVITAQRISTGAIVTWDLCLVGPNFITCAPYWTQLFSEAEIAWQRDVRTALRAAGRESETYILFKGLSLMEARWRLAACWAEISPADHELHTNNRPDLGPCPERMHNHCAHWSAGDMRMNWLDRPLGTLDPMIVDHLRGINRTDLIQAEPSPPSWVERLHHLQMRQRSMWFRENSQE